MRDEIPGWDWIGGGVFVDARLVRLGRSLDATAAACLCLVTLSVFLSVFPYASGVRAATGLRQACGVSFAVMPPLQQPPATRATRTLHWPSQGVPSQGPSPVCSLPAISPYPQFSASEPEAPAMIIFASSSSLYSTFATPMSPPSSAACGSSQCHVCHGHLLSAVAPA